MNRYRITFVGRRVGAIGVFYKITAERDADSPEKAIEALYDEYEHIAQPKVELLYGAPPPKV